MRTRHVIVGGLAAVLLAAAATAGGYALRRPPATAEEHADTVSTVPVRRGDLKQRQRLTGRLGYAGAQTVTGMGAGLITWLPSVGSTVARGGQLFRADDAPVTLLFGDMPLYRTLGENEEDSAENGEGTQEDTAKKHDKTPPAPPQTGHDVDLLAENLVALGFWHGTTTGVDYDHLVPAIRAWQASLGEAPTGTLTLGTVVMAPGPVRILEVLTQVGDQAEQQVVKVTGTRRTLTLQAPPSLAQALAPGRRVRVQLGDGRRIVTRIAHIGAETEDANGEPSLPVVVTPLRAKALRSVEPGTVTADLVTASRRNVLRVPVNALLALSGGGYAVERPDRELVPVKLGLIANGKVEVSGIEAGALVVVAR